MSLHRFLQLAVVLSLLTAGCQPVVKTIADLAQNGDRAIGVTYYVGGAGPIGNIGTISIPKGLEAAGYGGYVEVFAWQTVTAAIDQVALERNRSMGAELADLILRQKRSQPDVPVHIIGLSAGTAIATFALERLPETCQVESVVFLASSLSSHYDLTRALRRVRGGLYLFYSPNDPILRNLMPVTGTVDRKDAEEGVAGLQGFRMPSARRRGEDTRTQYMKVHNIRYRREFAECGYEGGHTDTTSQKFIERYVAPLLLNDDRRIRTARAGSE